jgi:hypothetical protein
VTRGPRGHPTAVPEQVCKALCTSEVNAALKRALPRAQTVVVSFLTVCGLLSVMFVEPPSRFWAGRGEPSDDRRPTWLAVVLLLELLAIAFVLPRTGLFDLRPIKALYAAVIVAGAVAWVFHVRGAGDGACRSVSWEPTPSADAW